MKQDNGKPLICSIFYFLHMRTCLTMNESTEMCEKVFTTTDYDLVWTRMWSILPVSSFLPCLDDQHRSCDRREVELATSLLFPLGEQGGNCSQSTLHNLLHVRLNLPRINVSKNKGIIFNLINLEDPCRLLQVLHRLLCSLLGRHPSNYAGLLQACS